MEKEVELEPGLDWPRFIAAYAVTYPGRSKEVRSDAWKAYKARALTTVTTKTSSKKTSPKPSTKEKVQTSHVEVLSETSPPKHIINPNRTELTKLTPKESPIRRERNEEPDILASLGRSGEYALFATLLRETGTDKKIDDLDNITVLAVEDKDMEDITHLSLQTRTKIAERHVLLDKVSFAARRKQAQYVKALGKLESGKSELFRITGSGKNSVIAPYWVILSNEEDSETSMLRKGYPIVNGVILGVDKLFIGPREKKGKKIATMTPEKYEGILATLRNYGEVEFLISILENSGIAEKIDALESCTIFFPLDEVLIKQLGEETVKELATNKDLSNNTLLTVLGRMIAVDTKVDVVAVYKNGKEVDVDDYNGEPLRIAKYTTYVGVSSANVPGKHGIIYVPKNDIIGIRFANGIAYNSTEFLITHAEKVLLKQLVKKPTSLSRIGFEGVRFTSIRELLTTIPNYELLLRLLTNAGLASEIDSYTDTTVFLVTNDVLLKALGQKVIQQLIATGKGRALPYSKNPDLLSILSRLIIPNRRLDTPSLNVIQHYFGKALAKGGKVKPELVTVQDYAGKNLVVTPITEKKYQIGPPGLKPAIFETIPHYLHNGIAYELDSLLVLPEEYNRLLNLTLGAPKSLPKLRKETEELQRTIQRPSLSIPKTSETRARGKEEYHKRTIEQQGKFYIVYEPYAIIDTVSGKPKLFRMTKKEWETVKNSLFSTFGKVGHVRDRYFQLEDVVINNTTHQIGFVIQPLRLPRTPGLLTVPSVAKAGVIVDQLEAELAKLKIDTKDRQIVIGIAEEDLA